MPELIKHTANTIHETPSHKELFRICEKIFITYFFIILPQITFGQLNGTKTIGGTSPDYITISDAVNDLHKNGVNGPLIFNIRDGVYNEQVFIDTM